MEKYLVAIVSWILSVVVTAFGYGKLSGQVAVNTDETTKARKLIDDHAAKTDIHIDPDRDRESQRIVVGRLAKVEGSLEALATEVRSGNREADRRQIELLQEVRAALASIRRD